MAESAEITVLTWNINGLKAKLETKQLKKEERKTKLLKIFDQYDIVLLQETKIGEMKDDKDYNKNWEIITKALSNKYALVKLEGQTLTREDEGEEEGGEVEGGDEDEGEEDKQKTMYMTYFSSRSKGVAILVNRPHKRRTWFSEGGFYAWVHVEIDKLKYTFVSVYYHPGADGQIGNLMSEISTEGSKAFKNRLVIGGDFNTTLNPKLDVKKENRDHDARRERVKEFLSKANMSDVWREMNPREREYTYNHQSRLDYIFMFENEVRYVKSCEILNDIDLSDHSPVSLTLKYTDIQPREE